MKNVSFTRMVTLFYTRVKELSDHIFIPGRRVASCDFWS